MLIPVIIYLAMIVFAFGFIGVFNDISEPYEFAMTFVLALIWPFSLTLSFGGFCAKLAQRIVR